MTERRYVHPRTGEIIEDPEIRPFHEVLRDLGEGATDSELSEGLWDLVQRVQETGKAGSLHLTLSVGFDGQGRISTKDEVKVKLPEFNRPDAPQVRVTPKGLALLAKRIPAPEEATA